MSSAGFVFTVEWLSDEDDRPVHDAHATITEASHRLAEEEGLRLPFLCLSFAGASQKALGSYGADSLKLLQDTARTYDSAGLFQNLQNDGFLLRNLQIGQDISHSAVQVNGSCMILGPSCMIIFQRWLNDHIEFV